VSADRRKRHARILQLVEQMDLRTQEELAAVLAEEGWRLTQSTVSRDIAALGLIKVTGAYRRPAVVQPTLTPDEQRIRDSVLTIDAAGDVLLVLRTPAGEANRLAVALDRLAWPEVVGTLAGDDTVFLAARTRAAQRDALRKVQRL
jgi:transcriptional regulator of arginine metabolism